MGTRTVTRASSCGCSRNRRHEMATRDAVRTQDTAEASRRFLYGSFRLRPITGRTS
jgi:hypothetical protein